MSSAKDLVHLERVNSFPLTVLKVKINGERDSKNCVHALLDNFYLIPEKDIELSGDVTFNDLKSGVLKFVDDVCRFEIRAKDVHLPIKDPKNDGRMTYENYAHFWHRRDDYVLTLPEGKVWYGMLYCTQTITVTHNAMYIAASRILSRYEFWRWVTVSVCGDGSYREITRNTVADVKHLAESLASLTMKSSNCNICRPLHVRVESDLNYVCPHASSKCLCSRH